MTYSLILSARAAVLGLVVVLATASATCMPAAPAAGGPAFPGAVGFGTDTVAGRGGRVIKVTNLNASGPGSFGEAVAAKGPRIVVFEVGGLIDLGGRSLKISQPFLTIAGQTAPSPGITFIQGGIGISTHDVLVQHIRIRTGDAGRPKKSGWEVDGLATNGAWNVVVDHCSIAWATDENLSASGERFSGQDVAEWRKNTSHDVTFGHCIVAEGLNHATHGKGGHSKGSLIHDNATRIAILGNLYASNVNRNPLFKGGVQGVIVNNFIYNPGLQAVHYRLVPGEWGNHPYVTGQMVLVGNHLQHGPDTRPDVPLLSYDGDGPMELYAQDNLARDRSGKPVELIVRRKGTRQEDLRTLDAPPLWPEGLRAIPADQVRDEVLKNAGARPWDRDEVDQRLIREVLDGTGRIIDSQDQVGAYPRTKATARKLDVPKENIEEWLHSFSNATP